jgi:hypothetical protein
MTLWLVMCQMRTTCGKTSKTTRMKSLEVSRQHPKRILQRLNLLLGTLYKPVEYGHPPAKATQVAFCTNMAIDTDHLVFESYKTYQGQQKWSTYTRNLTKLP